MQDKVYIVQFDWATSDASGIDLHVFKHYGDAYDKFKRNPELSWVGDLEFDDDGFPVDDRYEFSFEDNNSNESEVWWHIQDSSDWYMHSYIDLLVKEVL